MLHAPYGKTVSANKGSNNGYTLIELILVVALLALFGIATLTLVLSSSTAYKGIMERKETDSGLRVALSYLDTKIKQNDAKDVIRLESNPSGNGRAVVIEEEMEGSLYETWIYLSAGKLREVLVGKGDPVKDELGFEIADIEGFDVNYDSRRKLLHLNVWSTVKDERHELGTDITVKTGLKDVMS